MLEKATSQAGKSKSEVTKLEGELSACKSEKEVLSGKVSIHLATIILFSFFLLALLSKLLSSDLLFPPLSSNILRSCHDDSLCVNVFMS
mmetsp:Transcript_24068/g.78309  ORF Transcript_24068/g.78309 Transcript_24068/m.78309 type:complete len:89 (-) Transcript_24068:1497-1763(-)